MKYLAVLGVMCCFAQFNSLSSNSSNGGGGGGIGGGGGGFLNAVKNLFHIEESATGGA